MKKHTTQELYDIFLQYPTISTDTRNIHKNSLFFALKGSAFDGNLFAEEALNKGAAYAIIDNPEYVVNSRCILVHDVLESLQQLAYHHRCQLQIPIIGITGTNGKTTTKELIHSVLATQYNCIATQGNLNNHIGVPLTLLSITPNTEIAIIEMGANHVYEIENLCKIALPTYGLITNIGKAHLEGFGSYENIIQAKSELYNFVGNTQGLLFVNADNNLLLELSHKFKRELYGSGEQKATAGIKNNTLSITFEHGEAIDTQLLGLYNFENVLAAVYIGKHFNISQANIKRAIENYVPSNNRSQNIKTAHNYLILDAYNANPTSMRAAIANFKELQTPNKVLCLGGMKEMGAESLNEHKSLISYILDLNLDFQSIILIGSEFEFANTDNRFIWFANTAKTIEYLQQNSIKNASILLKGSRGMALEKLVEHL